MSRRRVVLVFTVAVVALAAASAAALSETGSHVPFLSPSGRPLSVLPRSVSEPAPQTVARRDYHHDTSKPLREMKPVPVPRNAERGREQNVNPLVAPNLRSAPDGALQTKSFGPNMPSTSLSFDGMSNNCDCYPPDTNGEAGATQYLEMDNLELEVFNKSNGASLLGPLATATIFSGFGGNCQNSEQGDPVVVYDQFANRWVVSQFAGPDTITDECVAVSQTSDATGSWHRYGFHLGSNFYDYPKLGVWNDAYYMSMNVFDSAGNAFLGPQPFAFDRSAMLAGQPATFVTTGLLPATSNMFLPGDADGSTPPPANAPNPFLAAGTASSTWRLYRFHVDFTTPANSTFTSAGTLSAAAFTALCPNTRNCVPQKGTTVKLDGIGDRAMFRSAYRNFGDHEALVGNMSVSVSGVAGIRWWEIKNVTSGTPAFVQQATYSPDSTSRWMGSVAMDAVGDMALGFSASSASINPQIRYAGRLVGDALNTMGQGEGTILAGTGSQTGIYNRWGDYSDLTPDPSDDCTFWYANEYYATTGEVNWKTHIASFKFPTCTSQHGTLKGTVTNSATNAGLGGATVLVNGTSISTLTDGSGAYSIVLPPGTYSVTFSKAGYSTKTVSGITVTDGGTTSVNAALAPVPAIVGNGSTITAESLTPPNHAIDPGERVSVALGVKNTGAAATSNLTGTLQATGGVTNPSGSQSYGVVAANGGTRTKTFSFTAAANLTCGNLLTATLHLKDGAVDLGNVTYAFRLGTRHTALSENFDGVTAPALPAGWTAVKAKGNDWRTSATGTPTPVADTAPNAAFADDPAIVSDKSLVTPALTQQTDNAQLVFRQNYDMESTYDGGVLEISVDGGSFHDILAAGGSFATGGYTGTISSDFGSPIAGRHAWTGTTSGAFKTTTVNLPASAKNHLVKLRFRQASDESVAAKGWRVDSLQLKDGWDCIPPYAADGSGTMKASTTAVSAREPHRTISFTYTAASGGIANGKLTLAVPSGWSAPSKTGSAAGYTTASTGNVSVLGQSITVSSLTLAAGHTLGVTYGSKAAGGPGATVGSTIGIKTWTTKERSTPSGVLTPLAISPKTTVHAQDGSGTMTSPTTSVVHSSTGHTITFTYTAAAGGAYKGTVTLLVPSGWSAPSQTTTAPGYTTASTGSLSVSGQTITVSNLTRAAGQTLTVTYGSKASGGPGATAPSGIATQTWTTKERSTFGAYLTALGVSPAIKVS
jgi:carboxypeptidase family protein